MPTPPQVRFDYIPGLMRQVMTEMAPRTPEILVLQALFEDPEQRIEGRFFVLPEPASFEAMLQSALDGSDGERSGV